MVHVEMYLCIMYTRSYDCMDMSVLFVLEPSGMKKADGGLFFVFLFLLALRFELLPSSLHGTCE